MSLLYYSTNKLIMKIFQILLFCSVLFLAACSDSDSESNEFLIGSWDLEQLNGDGKVSTLTDGTIVESDIAVSSGEVSYVVTFSESSYVTAGSYDITNETIDADTGSKTFEPLVYTNASGSGTYNLNDNIITSGGAFIGVQIAGVNLGLMAGEQKSTIESLTAKELIFLNTQEKSLTQGDSTVTVVLNSRSVWSKR